MNVSVEGGAAAHETTSALTLAADKVHAFGGSVIELGRTGLDAAFGFDALEGAAERAAYAVLAIQRARARDLEPSRRAPVARLALHTDSYLVGRIGASNQIDQDAKQTASTVLAKLIAVAEPDTAVVSGTALRFLRRRFDCAGPLPSAEEPRSETPSAYRLLGRMDVFDKAVTPFVGRDNEMTLLASRWSLAREGMGQVVGIVGEPGVGKSRLVWEFIHGGHDLGGLVLETASVALGRPTPYLAIIDLLRAYFRVESGDGDDAIREKVARHLEDLDPALVNLLPAFLSLLDVTTEDSAWAALDPTRRRQRTVDAIRRLMLRASARQPLLLLFEDAHWADSETRALLDTIADSLRAARVLILVTFRPEYEHGWGQRSFYTQIRVDPLRGDGVEQFLGDLLGRHPSMDPSGPAWSSGPAARRSSSRRRSGRSLNSTCWPASAEPIG